MVGNYYHVFVGGCEILDAAIITNEIVDSMMKRNMDPYI